MVKYGVILKRERATLNNWSWNQIIRVNSFFFSNYRFKPLLLKIAGSGYPCVCGRRSLGRRRPNEDGVRVAAVPSWNPGGELPTSGRDQGKWSNTLFNPETTGSFFSYNEVFLYPTHNEVVGRVYWFHSVRLYVRPSVPHPVSALQHLQFWMDPFHIQTSYQTTSEGVSHVKFIAKFEFMAVF